MQIGQKLCFMRRARQVNRAIWRLHWEQTRDAMADKLLGPIDRTDKAVFG